MRRKILIGSAVLVMLGAFLLVQKERNYQLATYRGKPARVWAEEFCQNFDPGGTNETVGAFHSMGSNAVPALRSMLKTREPFYEKPFLQNARQIPIATRRYLFEKIKPGKTAARRVAAARALGVVGADASAAVPDLAAALEDGEVRWASAQALASIGGQAIPALTSAATSKNDQVRHAAVYGLGQAGTNAWPATVVLLDRVLDTNEPVRASALYSLGRIGRAGLPLVLEAFSSDDAARRDAAVKAIRAMNTPPRHVLRTLLEYTANSSPGLRAQSVEALQALRLNHPQAVATCVRALNDPDGSVRTAAARAMRQAEVWATNQALGDAAIQLLGRSGPLDRNIIAALQGLLNDLERSVRSAAQQSLTNIQSSATD